MITCLIWRKLFLRMYLCHRCIDESFFYVSQFGHYVKEINRGDLKIPRDPMCQWVIYCHVKVLQDASVTCRSSIGNLAMIIYMSNFGVGRDYATIAANIFFNNFYKLYSPSSSHESNQKLLKFNC